MKNKEILILLVCFLTGFALRFYTFDKKSLWIDEIYTLGDSRDGIKEQIEFYKKTPTYLHPPLFFVLTHQFFPFTKPERDLRILPLVFGTLSIPMIYVLAKQFSFSAALPSALFLTFMTYHISLSQDGRAYSLLMFLGMACLYFIMKHLQTLRKKFIIFAGFLYSCLFYTSYSTIPFIVFSQVLCFYRATTDARRPTVFLFVALNSVTLLLCLPWIIFVGTHVKALPWINLPYSERMNESFLNIIYGILHDWVPNLPLMVISTSLIILFPFITKHRRSALVLLLVLILPMGGLYAICNLTDFNHFVSSKYFICFLPLLFISLLLALDTVEMKFENFSNRIRFKTLFIIFFISSNLIIFPFYYRFEKQDFRGLANFLKGHVQDGDKISLQGEVYLYGLLHYLGIDPPKGREYLLHHRTNSENVIEYYSILVLNDKKFTISYSNNFWKQTIADDLRTWFIVDKANAEALQKKYHLSKGGYFDGSFMNLNKFPTDGSIYLFLLDPNSPSKEMDPPIRGESNAIKGTFE
jgi:hypothetical protein